MSGTEGLDTDDAASHGGAIEAGAPATAETDATDEPELEGEEGEGGEGEEPAAGAEVAPQVDELAALRQQLAELEPLARLGQHMLSQQPAPAPQQAPSQGVDPRVEQALRVAHDTAQFKAFPPEVQFEAGRILREAEEDHILRLTNPRAWAAKWVEPVAIDVVRPVAAKFAKREFMHGNPDLASPEDEQAVADAIDLARRSPAHVAAELVRLRKQAATGGPRAEIGKRATAADAEALKNARRGRAAPPRTTTRAPSPNSNGWRAEDALHDFEGSGLEE